MRSIAVLAVLLFVAHVLAQNTNISAVTTNGIDMMEIDSPGWLTNLQLSHLDHQIVVFGQSTLRYVATSFSLSGFTALPVTPEWVAFPYELNDLQTVQYFNVSNNASSLYTIGVSDFTIDLPSKWGAIKNLYLPLVIMRPSGSPYFQSINDTRIGGSDFTGTMFSAVRVDPRNFTDVLAYYGGWGSYIDPFLGNVIFFGLFRTHLTLPPPPSGLTQTIFTFNSQSDVANFYQGQFSTFSANYKPFIHEIQYFTFGAANNVTLLVVADPNTRTVYSGYFLADGSGWQVVNNVVVSNIVGSVLVSAAMSSVSQLLYVGLAVSGANATGYIVAINLAMGTASPYALPSYCNNPKALALDEAANVLYIGLNGGSEVLKFDLSINNVTGYQRLPEWLHRSWAGQDSHHEHVYFITNEEHSKVYRVNKADFCSSRCPYMGYCSAGSCTCATGYTLTNGNSQCTLSQLVKVEKEYQTTHGGEIALGILFAFAIIGAAAGWGMWYRGRRQSYQAVH